MSDMSKLLGELGKTHSETDAKTLFNELEIAADGTGWILDLPTFMVLMLHKGSRRNTRVKRLKIGKSTKQWQALIADGNLPTTEIVITETLSAEDIEFERYRFKSFAPSQSRSIKYPNLQNEYGIEFPLSDCLIHRDLYSGSGSDGPRDCHSQGCTSSLSSVLFKDTTQIVPEPHFAQNVIIRKNTAAIHRKRCCIL